MRFDNPLIVQSDRTLLLDVHAPLAGECRAALIPFAELERSPEHLHTYRLTQLSLWNAASAGFSADDAAAVLEQYARYEVPQAVLEWIRETVQRFGKLRLVPAPGQDGREYLYLVIDSAAAAREIASYPAVKRELEPCAYAEDTASSVHLSAAEKKHCFRLPLTARGTIKQLLLGVGWPVKDDVPLRDGEPLLFHLRETCASGAPFVLRAYQKEAADALVGTKGPGSGFGTIVLPCGAGKTIVGMCIMERLQTCTLILTTNISAVHQWKRELLDKTDIPSECIGEYTGEAKDIRPITVATYQVLTWRPDSTAPFPHFQLFRERAWGLIIYDEVHMLPAPVFRVTAELQAVRRAGLTATLVREDGCEGHVFSLVGPKRYDVPWKELESSGWIAGAECIEVRLDLPPETEIPYAAANVRQKHRIASENPLKKTIVQEIAARFPEDHIIVIGQYVQQLADIAALLDAPLITGKTPSAEREQIYDRFRSGQERIVVVSKVANFAIDLPDASLAVQVSGTFGSRQEEAQRLGRILRPKERTARFFTLITRNSVEEDFGSNRQKFLAEQGYAYRIIRYAGSDSLDELCSEPNKGRV